MTEAELWAAHAQNALNAGSGSNAAEVYAILEVGSAIDRLTAEVKALREAQQTALRLAQGTVFRGEGTDAD